MSAITAKASRKMKKYAVLTREPRCFLGSFDFSWEQRKLGELVDRVVRKNTNNESTLPLTISAQYGLVDQITYFNNRVASRDVSNYYLVLNGEFAYNKSTSDGYPFGAVKRLDLYEKGVLSTLYIVFAPKKEQQIDSDYLTVFFDTDRWHKGVAERAAEGARNHGLLNISAEDFFDIDLSVPKDIVEQKQIGAFIRQLDNLITLHQRKCVFLFGFFQAFISMIFTASTFSWEQRKFSDVVATRRGLTYKPSDIRKNGVRVLRSSNIAEDSFVLSDEDVFVVREAVNIDCVRANDILITAANGSSRLVGKHTIISGIPEESAVHGGFMLLGTTKEPHFVNASMGSSWYRRFIELFVAGGNGAIGNLNKNDLDNQDIAIPSEKEQKKIGSFFRQLDNLITLHQRECISFTARAGRRILTANKKRNTSSWEQRKFSDVVATRRGLTYKPSDIRKNGVRVLRSSNIAEDSFVLSDEDVFVVREAVNIDCVRANDILITAANGSSRLVGKHTIISGIPEESAVHGGFMLLGTTKEPHFVNASMGSSWYRRFIELFVAGGNGAIGNLNKNDLDNQDIAIPSEKEQKKIGSFFRQLDNLITLHQRKPFLMKWRTSDANRNKTNRLVL